MSLFFNKRKKRKTDSVILDNIINLLLKPLGIQKKKLRNNTNPFDREKKREKIEEN